MVGVLILVIGCLGAIFSLINSDGKNKLLTYVSIALLIAGTGLTLHKELKTEEEKERDQRELTKNFKSTLDQGDSAIQRINIAIDSLHTIQLKTQEIIALSDTQLKLQSKAMDTSRFLLQKSQILLAKQSATDTKTNRLLYPMFPMTFGICIEIPFSNKNIQPLLTYMKSIRERLKTEKIPGLENQKYGYLWSGVPHISFNYDFLPDSLKENYNFFPEDFYISLTQEKSPPFNFNNPNIPQLHFCVSRFCHTKNPLITLNINFEDKIVEVRFHYTDYTLVPNSAFKSTSLFGADELTNLSLLLSHSSSQSSPISVTRIWFTKMGTQHFPVTIDFKKENSITKRGRWGDEVFLFHKITKADFKLFSDYWE